MCAYVCTILVQISKFIIFAALLLWIICYHKLCVIAFKDLIFMDNKLSTKAAKIMSLRKLCMSTCVRAMCIYVCIVLFV